MAGRNMRRRTFADRVAARTARAKSENARRAALAADLKKRMAEAKRSRKTVTKRGKLDG